MSADPKEEEYIHNPIDELWKLTDNQQLSLDQMSCSLKSHKKLDGAHEEKKKTTHSGGPVQQNQLHELQFNSSCSGIRRHGHQTHCILLLII